MTKSLSTKRAAKLLGVSESTIKRWSEHDALPFTRTAGGHRRFALDDLIAFRNQADLKRRPLSSLATGNSWQPGELLLDLLDGDSEACANHVAYSVCSGDSPESLCDDVWAPCFVEIGRRWETGEASVYQERRACEIFERAILEVIQSIPQPSFDAPTAMGATPSGDGSRIPSRMIEYVLRANGWRVYWLGANLPFSEMAKAIACSPPHFFWLTVCHLSDAEQFLADYAEFHRQVASIAPIVVGGRALSDSVRSQMKYTAFGDRIYHLLQFANTVATPTSIGQFAFASDGLAASTC